MSGRNEQLWPKTNRYDMGRPMKREWPARDTSDKPLVAHATQNSTILRCAVEIGPRRSRRPLQPRSPPPPPPRPLQPLQPRRTRQLPPRGPIPLRPCGHRRGMVGAAWQLRPWQPSWAGWARLVWDADKERECRLSSVPCPEFPMPRIQTMSLYFTYPTAEAHIFKIRPILLGKILTSLFTLYSDFPPSAPPPQPPRPTQALPGLPQAPPACSQKTETPQV